LLLKKTTEMVAVRNNEVAAAISLCSKGKALYRPRGFQEVEAPKVPDNRRMKVVGLSALRTGRLYAPAQEMFLVLISITCAFCNKN